VWKSARRPRLPVNGVRREASRWWRCLLPQRQRRLPEKTVAELKKRVAVGMHAAAARSGCCGSAGRCGRCIGGSAPRVGVSQRLIGGGKPRVCVAPQAATNARIEATLSEPANRARRSVVQVNAYVVQTAPFVVGVARRYQMSSAPCEPRRRVHSVYGMLAVVANDPPRANRTDAGVRQWQMPSPVTL